MRSGALDRFVFYLFFKSLCIPCVVPLVYLLNMKSELDENANEISTGG